MRQSQYSVLPKTRQTPKRRVRIDTLWPVVIGGMAALVVSGFMMVSHAPMIHPAPQPHSVTKVSGGQP
jgi:hypothetical protein